eukprot:6081297-Lingulodinium_polyedra.AAC.1
MLCPLRHPRPTPATEANDVNFAFALAANAALRTALPRVDPGPNTRLPRPPTSWNHRGPARNNDATAARPGPSERP